MHELQLLNDIQLAWSGQLINDGSDIGTKLMQMNVSIDKENIIPNDKKENLGSKKPKISKGLLPSWRKVIDDDAVTNFVLLSQYFLSQSPEIRVKGQKGCSHNKDRSNCSENSSGLFDSVLYEDVALGLLSVGSVSSSTPPSSSVSLAPGSIAADTPNSIPLSTPLKGWLTLLTAKTLLYAGGDHQKAYTWVRKSLAYMAPAGGSSSSADKRGNLGMGGSCLSLDKCLPRLEGLLLSADLYEQTGNRESCLSYISEATSISKTTSKAFSSIVAMHSLRLWQRMRSSRFASALNELSEDAGDNEDSVDAFTDDVSNQIKSACKVLAGLLSTEVQVNGEHNHSSTLDHLQYRHLNHCWDPQLLQGQSINVLNTTRKLCHTIFLTNDRILLNQFWGLSKSCMGLMATCSSGGRNDEKCNSHKTLSDYSQQLLIKMKDSLSFDLIRDLRRVSCLHSLHQSIGDNVTIDNKGNERQKIGNNVDNSGDHNNNFINAMRSFILGASSCSTALECSMSKSKPNTLPSVNSIPHEILESSTTASNETVPVVSNELPNELPDVMMASKLIRGACCKDNTALHTIQKIIENFAISGNAVCFAIIEPSTRNLIVGRYDKAGPVVVSLPIADELNLFLTEWNSCMEKVTELLKRSSASGTKWTEIEKRAWWEERSNSDILIGTLLFKLENLLGQWSGVFSGSIPFDLFSPSTSCTPSSDSSKSDLPHKEGSDITHLEESLSNISIVNTIDKECNEEESIENHSSEDLNALKVTELRQRLKDEKLLTTGKKSDLVSRLQEYLNERRVLTVDVSLSNKSSPPSLLNKGSKQRLNTTKTSARTSALNFTSPLNPPQSSPSSSGQQGGHTILILDEQLQQIPWESIPCLKAKQCSRVPSFALLLHMLTRKKRHKDSANTTDAKNIAPSHDTIIDSHANRRLFDNCMERRKIWYSIDPESNLPATREKMFEFLKPYIEKMEWEGFVAEMPSEEEAR
jgi:hypothetical protein